MKKWGISLALSGLLGMAPASAQEPTTYDRAIAAGYKAAFLCSGIFNAGRTEAQIEADELRGIYPDYAAIVPTLEAEVNRAHAVVTVAFDDALPPRRAEWRKETGCTNMPIGAVAPPIASSYRVPPPGPLKPDPRPWPMGDIGGTARAPAALAPVIAKAFDRATFGKGSETTGIVIVHDGNIVAERYRDGFGPMVSQRTWSVGKSIAGTLVGIAVERGLVDVDKPARIPEWGPSIPDPRQNITFDQLLRMASGLHSDTAGNRTDGIYFGGTAVTEEATGWPLDAVPGKRFRYANNDTLLAVRALRAEMGDKAYATFPRTALFERIGMTRTVAETDWRGNYILSSQVWTTARDLARFGLLYANDGVWQGERILPAGWVDYATKPSGPQPAKGPGYGATFWLFGPDQGLPDDAYAAQGNRGQYVMILPSAKLVIVRRGEDGVGQGFDIAAFSKAVLDAAAGEQGPA